MTRRRLTLGICAAVVAILAVAAVWLPVPYVVLLPGPTFDTLGTFPTYDSSGNQTGSTPTISITGASTQPTSGHLYLTTVDVEPGDCSARPSLMTVLEGWVRRSDAVLPHDAICPPDQTTQQVTQQNVHEMAQSQDDAVVAALLQLGYQPVPGSEALELTAPGLDGTDAGRLLQVNDDLVSIDGQELTKGLTTLQTVVRAKPVGSAFTVVVKRGSATLTLTLRSTKGPQGYPILGLDGSALDLLAKFPSSTPQVKVGVDPNVVGGPSAGMMLALGIIDKLTPGGLTGGRTIAGTGTIDGFGNVGPIGGIQQKIAAAASRHVSVFLAPASECSDAKAVAPSSMTLVSVDTLSTAVKALKDIEAGTTDFPHC